MSEHPSEPYAALLALMRERRSIRRFRAERLPDGTVERLMEAARWAPSASNRQGFRFIAVEQAELRAEMAQAVREALQANVAHLPEEERTRVLAYAEDFVRFDHAPLVLVAYHRADNLLGERYGLTPKNDLGAVESVSASIMCLLLAAHALGLGACWTTGPLVAAAALEKLLAVPTGWQLSAVIPVGIPDESPPAPARRKISQLLIQPRGPA
jgi:coenzyme F420-0:L-glutamate ligase / coenzyme F420-1:gamma-L-glutamate ligase